MKLKRRSFAEELSYWLGIVAFGLVFGLGIQFTRAWVDPTTSPPGGNVGAPINTSGNAQGKTGSLGVGKLAPSYTLDVNGWINTSAGGAYGVGGMRFGYQTLNSKSDGWLYVGDQSGSVYGSQGLAAGNLYASGSSYAGIFYDANDGAYYVNPNSASKLNNLVINGSLGIGVGSPSYKLDVAGNAHFTGAVKFDSGIGWSTINQRTETRTDAGLRGDAGAQSGFFQNDGSGVINYPFGASGWWHLLDVRHSNTTNNYAMQIAGSFFDQNLYFRKTNNSPTTGWSQFVAKDAAGNVSLPSGIWNSAGVGIGTASPTYKLQVVGDIYANGGWLRTSGNAGWYSESYGGGWYMTDTNWIRAYNNKNVMAPYFYSSTYNTYLPAGTGTGNYLTKFTGTYTVGNSILYDDGGSIGIGTSAPAHKLDVAGEIHATGDVCTDVSGGKCLSDIPTNTSFLGSVIPSTGSCTGFSNGLTPKIFNSWESIVQPITVSGQKKMGIKYYQNDCSGCGNNYYVVYFGKDASGNDVWYKNGVGASTCFSFLCDCSGSGGSTPFLFTSLDNKYLIENDVMTTYVHQNYEPTKKEYETNTGDKNNYIQTDRYKLNISPTIYPDGIKLMLKELEPEESHIDEIKLARVIHSDDSEVVVNNQDNSISVIKRKETKSMTSCQFNGDYDCMDDLSKTDNVALKGNASDKIEAHFNITDLKDKKVLLKLNAWYMTRVAPELKPYEASSAYSIKMTVSDPNDPNTTLRYRDIHPRDVQSDNYVDITDMVKGMKGDEMTVDLEYTAMHWIDSVTLVSIEDAPYRVENINLNEATSTRYGDILSKLQNLDHTYADTVTGDKINLTFAKPQMQLGENEKDDYVFQSSGFYHGLRTYLWPTIDPTDHSVEAVKSYVKELNQFLGK